MRLFQDHKFISKMLVTKILMIQDVKKKNLVWFCPTHLLMSESGFIQFISFFSMGHKQLRFAEVAENVNRRQHPFESTSPSLFKTTTLAWQMIIPVEAAAILVVCKMTEALLLRLSYDLRCPAIFSSIKSIG